MLVPALGFPIKTLLSKTNVKKQFFLTIIILTLISACQTNIPQTLPIEKPNQFKLNLEVNTTLTNDILEFSLKLEEAQPDSLELWLDGLKEKDIAFEQFLEPLSTLVFIWSSKHITEGVHTVFVVARLQGISFESQKVSFELDRTPPTLQAVLPSFSDVPSEDFSAISLLFSETIDVTRLNSSQLILTTDDNKLLETNFRHSKKELQISFKGNLQDSKKVTLELRVQDLAGNAIDETLVWTLLEKEEGFLLPHSLIGEYKPQESPVQLATNVSGDLAVMWLDGENLKAKLRKDKRWLDLPSIRPAGQSFNPQIILTQTGKPIIAWQTYDEPTDIATFKVLEWTGSSWSDLIFPTSDYSRTSAVLAVNGDSLYVAFLEHHDNQQLKVIQLSNKTWSNESETLNLDPQQNASYPALALNQEGDLYLAWREDRKQDKAWNIHVKHLQAQTWQQLGASLNINPYERADMPSLAIMEGHPVIAWSEYDLLSNSNNIYVKHWQNETWQALGGAVENYSDERAVYPSIAVSPKGQLAVSLWVINKAEHETVELAYFLENNWQNLGALNSNQVTQAYYPSLEFRKEQAVIAWLEREETQTKIVVKQMPQY